MKKYIYIATILASASLTSCGDADEMPPRIESDWDKSITLPSPPRLNDVERDIISQQRQELNEFVAGGGVKETKAKTESDNQ